MRRDLVYVYVEITLTILQVNDAGQNIALLITPNIPSVNAVSKPPALPTRSAICFLTPRPRALSAIAVGTTMAGDTDANIDPR